jgi:hypothetical protein
MHWLWRNEDIDTVGREKTSRSLRQLFHPWLCFMAPLVLCFITRSSWPNSIGCSEWKKTFSSSKVKDNIPHLGKNFQTEVIISAMEDDILFDRLNRMGKWSRVWDHNIMAQKWMGTVITRVLLECNGYGQVLTKPQRYDLMIDRTQELVGSERYACST